MADTRGVDWGLACTNPSLMGYWVAEESVGSMEGKGVGYKDRGYLIMWRVKPGGDLRRGGGGGGGKKWVLLLIEFDI